MGDQTIKGVATYECDFRSRFDNTTITIPQTISLPEIPAESGYESQRRLEEEAKKYAGSHINGCTRRTLLGVKLLLPNPVTSSQPTKVHFPEVTANVQFACINVWPEIGSKPVVRPIAVEETPGETLEQTKARLEAAAAVTATKGMNGCQWFGYVGLEGNQAISAAGLHLLFENLGANKDGQ